MHFKNAFEILYVLSGQVVVSNQDYSYTLGEDEFIVLNRFRMYSVLYSENAQSISLIYSPAFLEQTGVRPIRCISTTRPEMYEIYGEIRAKLANLYQIYLAGYEEYELYLLSDSYELFGILKRYFQEETFPANAPDQNYAWLAEVMRDIESCYSENITLSSVSRRHHVSEGHLSRTFRQQIGLSFTEYVRRLRIDKACLLLLKTDKSVTFIAGECGFGYVNTFIEAFKKELGTTPQKYRKHTRDTSAPEVSGVNYTADRLLKQLRDTDFERFQGKREIISPVEVDVNMKAGRPWKHNCHNQSIKISHSKLLLFEEVREALRQARSEIGFEYIHIHGILDDVMNVCREKPGNGYVLNFVYVDLAVDFILSIGMKPWIEIGYTPYCLKEKPSNFLADSCLDLPDSLDEWESIVNELIKHWVVKYGKKGVEQWRFAPVYELYSYYGIYDLSDYLNYYERFYRLLRKNLPKAVITGWGFQLETIDDDPESDFCKTLSFCREKGIFPDLLDFQFFHIDFSKIDEEMMGQAIRAQHETLAVIHDDPEYLSTKLNTVKQIMENFGTGKIPFAIGSWNCGLWQRDRSNDTCFKAAFIIKNVLENTEMLSEITYCNLSDFTEQVLTTPKVFHGGNGLVTYQNIKKAAYFAFSFLNHMNSLLVSKGKSFCVTKTKDNRQIDILLYHYCHYKQDMGDDHNSNLISDNSDRYGTYGFHAPLSISLHLQRLQPGKYTIERYVINREQGSSFDAWIQMGAPNEMADYQRKYLIRQTQPGYSCQTAYISNTGTVDISALLQIYEIQHIRLKMSEL